MTSGSAVVVAASILLGISASTASASTPVPSPTLVLGSRVDPAEAVVLPVQDIVAGSEKLVFAEASVDGAVTDRGGREFTLTSDVVFAFDKATLTSRARTELARIASVLKSAPDAETSAKVTRVSVTGYTDDVGSNPYNLGLSRRRAAAVRAELVRALGSGITVSAAGRGEADPVASNDTERGRQANRRVEIDGG